MQAEIDGQSGHGLSRVSSTTRRRRAGKVDGHARPACASPAPAFSRGCRDGFAYPAIDAAWRELGPLAESDGRWPAPRSRGPTIAGQLGAHVERLAEAGFVALMVTNTPKAIAAWGGRRGVVRYEPHRLRRAAHGRCAARRRPVAFVVARAKVWLQRRKGEPIPEGWALDADGRRRPTPPRRSRARWCLRWGQGRGAGPDGRGSGGDPDRGQHRRDGVVVLRGGRASAGGGAFDPGLRIRPARPRPVSVPGSTHLSPR